MASIPAETDTVESVSGPSERDTSSAEERDQSFSSHQNLKSPHSAHSAQKRHLCTVCPQGFARLHDLKRHQRLHDGVKPFRCTYCNKSFSRQDALTRHLKVEGKRGPCSGLSRKQPGQDSSQQDYLKSMDNLQVHRNYVEMATEQPMLLQQSMSYYATDTDLERVKKQLFRSETENSILRNTISELEAVMEQLLQDKERMGVLEAKVKELEAQLQPRERDEKPASGPDHCKD